MIRLGHTVSTLDAESRFGLDVLLDVARVPLAHREIDCVQLHIHDHGAETTHEAGQVHVPRSLLRETASLVGFLREQHSDARDRHGRVPSSENELVARHLEQIPIAHDHAIGLRLASQRAAGDRPFLVLPPWPEGRSWAAAISHDVDIVDTWFALTLVRALEVARGHDFSTAARILWSGLGGVGRDPLLDSVRRILETESRLGFDSTWFVLTGRPTLRGRIRKDVTYSLDSRPARETLSKILDRRQEIALHGSFASAELPGEQARQRRDLARYLPNAPCGVRQHFIKMRPGATQREMAAAGFEYDASFGFPDRAGFRLGLADCSPVWDGTARTTLPLEAVPMMWMDRTSSKYSGVEDPRRWLDPAMVTADAARAREGLWVGIWHPYLTSATGFPGAEEAFQELLHALAQDRPWCARLTDVVSWRRWRRAIRVASAADPDHPISVEAPEGPWRLDTGSDARGNPVAISVLPSLAPSESESPEPPGPTRG